MRAGQAGRGAPPPVRSPRHPLRAGGPEFAAIYDSAGIAGSRRTRIDTIYWIEVPARGRLGILPRPRGGDWLTDEVAAWRSELVDVVASLLTPAEADELGLAEEAATCAAVGIEHLALPTPDRAPLAWVPATFAAVERLAQAVSGGKSVAIHCRQGLGRAPTLAAAVLVRLGTSPNVVFEAISRARGESVPETAEQRAWVERYATARTGGWL